MGGPTEAGIARFSSIRFLVEAKLRGWLPLMGVVLGEEQIQQILQEAEHALARYAAADDTMTFEMAAHIIHGTKA